jgi:hypothetical protein
VAGLARGCTRAECFAEPGDWVSSSAPIEGSGTSVAVSSPLPRPAAAQPASPAKREERPRELWSQVERKGEVLKLADLGKRPGTQERGGRRRTLVVRLHYGGSFSDPGRPKFGPGHIDPTTILDHTVKYWRIGGLIEHWREHPEEIPDRLIGLAGPVRQRFVVSSLPIDTERLFKHWEACPGEIAVAGAGDGRVDLDCLGFRFCQVKDARFGNLPRCFFIWVDRDGQERAGGRKGKKSLT